mgnify:CR=1 FL=1
MKNINSDIRKAHLIDKIFYLDDKIYDTVINNVFNNAWQFISDVNYLKNYNVFPFVFLEDSINEPMLLINNQSVKCLSNICTHRAHTIVKKNVIKNYYNVHITEELLTWKAYLIMLQDLKIPLIFL